MAAANSEIDVLSRVRREQRMQGKTSRFSGLHLVLAATAITVAILLFAFGAIGMLMMARSPQEPLASKLDPAPLVVQQPETPPVLQQSEVPPPVPETENSTSHHEKTVLEPEKKTVKTLRVIAPPEEKSDTVAQQQAPTPEPETTATIPPASQTQQPQQVPQREVRERPVRQQQAVRRKTPEPQYDNPLFELFGIKKYR